MFKVISVLLSLCALSACGATPEIVLNEDLPTAVVSSVASPEPPATAPASAPVLPPPDSEPSIDMPAQTAPIAPVSVEPSAPALRQISEGSFRNGFHKVSGQASLIENGDQKFLRVENFSTENGPDLFFYLIRNDSGQPQGGDFIDLGRLKATQGSANYEIPAEINLADYQSVSVWCKAFSVNFGSAKLTAQ